MTVFGEKPDVGFSVVVIAYYAGECEQEDCSGYEEGSEAAAVSIGGMKKTDAGPGPGDLVVFHADRPFLYFITENSSGAILFSGRFNG